VNLLITIKVRIQRSHEWYFQLRPANSCARSASKIKATIIIRKILTLRLLPNLAIAKRNKSPWSRWCLGTSAIFFRVRKKFGGSWSIKSNTSRTFALKPFDTGQRVTWMITLREFILISNITARPFLCKYSTCRQLKWTASTPWPACTDAVAGCNKKEI